MSIRSLTNEELSRRMAARRMAVSGTTAGGSAKMSDATSEREKKATNANDAIDVIMNYIPTEAITLYIAALPVLSSLNAGALYALSSLKAVGLFALSFLNVTTLSTPSFLNKDFHMDGVILIIIFTILTGILTILSYAGDYNKKNEIKWSFFKRECWPWWSIISSMFAFIVWAWAIPNPLAKGQVEVSAISTFVLIATSILLPMIGQVVAPSQGPNQ